MKSVNNKLIKHINETHMMGLFIVPMIVHFTPFCVGLNDFREQS